MKKTPTVFAKNIKIGSVVSIYNEDWICCGSIEIYDGDFGFPRVMLSSTRQPSLRYTFVHPFHEFSFCCGTFSDSQEIPF